MAFTALFVVFLCYSVVHRVEGSAKRTATGVPSSGFLARDQESVEAWVTRSPRNTHKVTPRALTGTPVLLWMDQHNGGLRGEQDILYFSDCFRAGHGIGKQGGQRGGERARLHIVVVFISRLSRRPRQATRSKENGHCRNAFQLFYATFTPA